MEYLERLGLVPRKSKKVRDTSSQPRRCAEESYGLKTDLTRAIGTDTTCATSDATSSLTAIKPAHTQAGLVDIARLPIAIPTSSTTTTTTTACFCPRPRSSATTATHEPFIDIDYLAYEQHVQAQARRARSLHNNRNINRFGSPFGFRFGAPVGRHAWKTLVFWRRRRAATGTGAGTAASSASCGSASSTPAGSHDRTPSRRGLSRRQESRGGGSAAGMPLYYCSSDDFVHEPAAVVMRAWCEPVGRRARMAVLVPDAEELCNRSPYVALAGGARGRRTLQGAASPGPLYLV